MPTDKSSSTRKRMVVEEVDSSSKPISKESEPVEPKYEEIAQPIDTITPPNETVSEPIPESTPQPPHQNSGDFSNAEVGVESTNNITWILIPGIMLLGALLGGIIFYQNKVSNVVEQTPTPTATITPSEVTPTPTSVSEDIDLEKYTINLQNGSGITGEASKVKGILEKAGFKVGTTGNASKYDYTSSIIQAKSSVDAAFISKLKEILGKTYKVGKDEVLKDTDKNEIIIIIGSSKS